MEIVLLLVWLIIWTAGWLFIFGLLPKKKDFCPRIYKGYNCRRDCDHSSRAWALIGIDLDELYTQPYQGHWTDPYYEGSFKDGETKQR